MHWRPALAIGVALLVGASSVRADGAPDKASCAAAHERGQIERKDGRLLAARESFAYCAQRTCPALARSDCTSWLAEIDAAIPTLVLAATLDGKAVHDMRVLVDGAVVLEHADSGATLSVDPGARRLRVELAGAKARESAVVVASGEKNRAVVVDLVSEQAPEPPPPPVEPRPSPTERPSAPSPKPSDEPATAPRRSAVPAIVAGGASIAGFTVFAVLGLRGVAEENRLRRDCKPSCDPHDVDALVTGYHVADVALLVGIAAAGVAAVLYLTR